jgi:putative FmdB family regulatory protein
MPTYEYRCRSCGHDFEKFQRMSDEPVADCPECGAPAERRLSPGAGVVFKGSGFYATDYRGGDYKKAADAEIKSTWKPDSLPESKSKAAKEADAKAAAKPAPAKE